MKLLAFGINHKTAPVDIREKVAFAPERLAEALNGLVAGARVKEAAILSTCNRTELYCCLNDADTSAIEHWFSDYHHLELEKLRPYFYAHPDNEAVRHLLRVASGLDSLVLGEPQILGQVKTAYRQATEAGTVGKILNRLCQHTFNVAKQVRTDTAIGESPVSVAFAAVSLSKQIFSNFEKHTAMLIGAGETIELAARHLHENGIGRMIIANRTVQRAQALADELGAYAIPLGDIPKHLAEADIVISSTASPLPILGKGSVERAIRARKHRPILMVDIAVPRDIEPEVGELADIYLYTVDDLQEIIQEGLKSRQEAAFKAEEIIDGQVSNFMGWMKSQDSVSLIREFRTQMDILKDAELEKAIAALNGGANAEDVLHRLAHNLTNKLSHNPTAALRRASQDGEVELLKAIQEIYNLKHSEEG
ncbi:MAG: glutamyl-tRNA reductase [Gammaproteobacteria bacterium]|nr:glutamyl-tRNA reductase [Gammaproteobacteria bacterium]